MAWLRNALILIPIALSGCIDKPVIPPPPARPVVARPVTPPAPAPAANWVDRALTPGTWTYARDARGGLARYGLPGANAALSIRCDVAARRIYVSRPGAVAARMTLRATTGVTAYQGLPTTGAAPYVAAALSPTDRQLDALAYSRGRFLVGMDGDADIIVPSWPEVARVIEDCRG